MTCIQADLQIRVTKSKIKKYDVIFFVCMYVCVLAFHKTNNSSYILLQERPSNVYLITNVKTDVKVNVIQMEQWGNLGSEEAVALLLHVVVDDPGNLLLPDLQAVDADVVLDVLERAIEAVHGGSHFLQFGHQLARLEKRIRWLFDTRI